MAAHGHKGIYFLLLGVAVPLQAAGGGGAPAAPSLKFNVAANSQYVPVISF